MSFVPGLIGVILPTTRAVDLVIFGTHQVGCNKPFQVRFCSGSCQFGALFLCQIHPPEEHMRRKFQEYGELARQEFLKGTTFRTPVDAVESGARSIEAWCDCLTAHRQSQRVVLAANAATPDYSLSD
jgi:hypothetical protein